MKKMNSLKLAFLVAATLFLAGCASFTDLPPGTVADVSGSPVIEEREVRVPAFETAERPPLDYQVGIGDVLFVNVNGKPELGSPVASGNNSVQGSRVDGQGNLRLPIVGNVRVIGLTVSQIQHRLQAAFSKVLKDPWVVVEVAEYKSQPLYLLGQFKTGGTAYMDRPLTLLQGLALGGGIVDTANLTSARLIRDGRTLPVDIYALLTEADQQHNIWLKGGDTIYVPDDKNQNVFVFGEVARPGAVAMPNGRLTLSQALAGSGMDGARDNEEYVRIIRSLSPTRGQLMVVDVNQILRGQTLPFFLKEGDIIYVPRSAVGNWNEAIREILPSLQAISAILQPFVQIEVLTDDD